MAGVTKTVQIAVRTDESLRDSLQEIAKTDDRQLSYVVRQALKEYVDRRGANGKAAA